MNSHPFDNSGVGGHCWGLMSIVRVFLVLGARVHGFQIKAWGLGLRFQGSGFRVQGSGFKIDDLSMDSGHRINAVGFYLTSASST